MKDAGFLTLSLMLVLIACGGDSPESDPTTVTTASVAAGGDDAPVATAPETEDGGDDVPVTTAPETEDGGSATGSATEQCEGLFSTSEMSDLFGEEAVLEDAAADESLGQLLCNWSTIEDPENLEDLAVGLVTLQLYGADPIGGEAFYDPSVYPDAQELDGIGDAAYLSGDSGSYNMAFLDSNTAGFFSYSIIDFGDPEPPPAITQDEAIDLLTTFHDRVS